MQDTATNTCINREVTAVLHQMATTLTFTFLALDLLLVEKATVDGRTTTLREEHVKGIIGAIIDYSSRMAIKDVFNKTDQRFDLHIKNTQTCTGSSCAHVKKTVKPFFLH